MTPLPIPPPTPPDQQPSPARGASALDGGRDAQVRAFLRGVGIEPAQGELLDFDRALTHKSYAQPGGAIPQAAASHHNERLEWLGDSAIGLVVSRVLFDEFPELDEGRLSRIRAEMISRRMLALVAVELGLEGVVRTTTQRPAGSGGGTGGAGGGEREPQALLGSALEALVGALVRNRPLAEVDAWIRARVVPACRARLDVERIAAGDPKTRLQEFTQAHLACLPDYETVDQRGPDHARTYTVEVRVQGSLLGRGEGRRVREAQDIAARQALAALEKR